MKTSCDDRRIFHNYQTFAYYGTHLVGYCDRCKNKQIARTGSLEEDEMFLRDLVQPGSKWFWFERGKCDQTSNDSLKKFIKESDWLVPEMGVRDATYREEFQQMQEELESEKYI
jgi:hypothetical protein